MKFVNFVRYRDLDKIAAARPAHFAYADGLRAQRKLAIGGPLTDDQGRRIALLFIYEASSRDEALTFAQEDPFTVANALSSYEISEWRLRGANLDLLIEANREDDKGGLFVYNALSRDEAMSCVKQDPFALEGVYADCELLEWVIEGLNPDLFTIA